MKRMRESSLIAVLTPKANVCTHSQAAGLFAQWGSTASNIPPGALMQLPTSMSIARVHQSTSPPASASIASTFPPSISALVAVPSPSFSPPSLSISPSPSAANTSIGIASPPAISAPVAVTSSSFSPASPITSPFSTYTLDTRQAFSTIYSNCINAGPSTLKTCFTLTASKLTGFTFPTPTPPTEDTQELDNSGPTEIPTPTPTNDMPEEAQTDMADAPEPTSEAVLSSADMTAVVITTTTSIYSTDRH